MLILIIETRRNQMCHHSLRMGILFYCSVSSLSWFFNQEANIKRSIATLSEEVPIILQGEPLFQAILFLPHEKTEDIATSTGYLHGFPVIHQSSLAIMCYLLGTLGWRGHYGSNTASLTRTTESCPDPSLAKSLCIHLITSWSFNL